MRRYRSWTLPALACTLLAASLGACSGEVPAERAGARDREAATPVGGAEASARASGCELVTTDEIEAAMGVTPATMEEGDIRIRGCDWTTADGRPLVSVVVAAAQRTYEEYVQNLREQLGSHFEDSGMTRVEGVGDYAIWHVEDGANYLNAAEDGELLIVMIWSEPVSGKSQQEAAVELARKALPRL